MEFYLFNKLGTLSWKNLFCLEHSNFETVVVLKQLISLNHIHTLHLLPFSKLCHHRAPVAISHFLYIHAPEEQEKKILQLWCISFFRIFPAFLLGGLKNGSRGWMQTYSEILSSSSASNQQALSLLFSFVFPQEVTSEYEGHLPECHCNFVYPQKSTPCNGEVLRNMLPNIQSSIFF